MFSQQAQLSEQSSVFAVPVGKLPKCNEDRIPQGKGKSLFAHAGSVSFL